MEVSLNILATTLGLWHESREMFELNLSSDTRTMDPGSVFIALVGENFDGNDFIGNVANARAIVASRYVKTEKPLFLVENTTVALGDIARKVRSLFLGNTRFIAITGSVGKTTTKDMLKMFLSEYGITCGTERNFNNHIGLPKTVVSLKKDARYAVLEMGMNHAGELTYLTNIAKPNIAIITSIDINHMQYFGNLSDIAKAKSEIFASMNGRCAVVLNRDHKFYNFLVHAARERGIRRIISYGRHLKSSVRLLKYVNGELTFSVNNGEAISYRLDGEVGDDIAVNSLAAVSVAVLDGLDPKRGCAALANFKLPSGKGDLFSIDWQGRKIQILDESYNSGPAAVASNVKRLLSIDGRRHVAILGDMLELGSMATEAHARISDIVNSLDLLVTIGPLMGAVNKNGPRLSSVEELLLILSSLLQDGDVVLIKGSMAWGMSRIIDNLKHGTTLS